MEYFSKEIKLGGTVPFRKAFIKTIRYIFISERPGNYLSQSDVIHINATQSKVQYI